MLRSWNLLGRRGMLCGCCLVACLVSPHALAQSIGLEPSATSSNSSHTQGSDAPQPIFLSYARFKIPYSIQARSGHLERVQLWVSTDSGVTWQLHGSESAENKYFDFRAASEGEYFFSVQTVDEQGAIYPSDSPPMRVWIDTTKPRAALRADVDPEGRLLVDVRVLEENLDAKTAVLRLKSDRDQAWSDVAFGELERSGEVYEARATVNLEPCREVALIFTIEDYAGNSGEATFTFSMPRTAAGSNELTLASIRGSSPSRPPQDAQAVAGPVATLQPLVGATPWEPAQPASSRDSVPPGRMASTASDGSPRGELSLEPQKAALEELPLPPGYTSHQSATPSGPMPTNPTPDQTRTQSRPELPPTGRETTPELQELDLGPSPSNINNAFYCNSPAFSLDYSVESLGGTALAQVELWGTDDGGRAWQKWGSDPDRQSPFDVKVGNDGLFGFRMVIVGANGLISNRPKDGDSADVWINVDTEIPTARITRAVYGEGPEDGMLVIDYTCSDRNLIPRPITLYYSASPDGEWSSIATGLKNSEIYLWKPPTNLPDRIYLRLEAADKAGNVGEHRLDLPIDVKGLAPRGRIQGFRPITTP